jgi:hypothetical protein
MARHAIDADRAFEMHQRPAAEGALEALVLRESLQRDVVRAPKLVGITVHDVCEDAALYRLV